MLFSAHEELGRLAPRFPAALVSVEALSWARAAAKGLPAVASACLECRLCPGATRTDLVVCVMATREGREALFGLPESSPLRRSPDWAPLFDFARAWSEPGSALWARVPFFCIELDLAGPPPEAPPPLVLVCLQPMLLAGPLRPRDPGERGQLQEILGIAKAVLSLLGQSPSPAVARTLAACIEALPPSGHVLHLGSLACRGVDALRFVCAMSKGEIPSYLRRIGWPGPLAEVEARIAMLHAHTNHVCFDLDVGPEVLPSIGLERYYARATARYAPLLDRLCVEGLCTAEKRDALLGWPGVEEVVSPDRDGPSTSHRLLELKVTCRAGAAPEAKAYLGFQRGVSPGSSSPGDLEKKGEP